MRKYIYIVILIIFTLSSLIYGGYYFYNNSVYNLIIPVDYTLWEKKINNHIYKLNEEEQKYLRHYLDRHNPNIESNINIEPIPLQITIKRAILIEKEYINSKQFQQDELNQNLIHNYISQKNELSDNIFITYLNKTLKIDNSLEVSYAVKNKSNQQITQIIGKLIFLSEQGIVLDTIDFDKKMNFPANNITIINENYNETQLNNFKFIKEIPSSKFNCKIIINSVQFKNGKTIIIPISPY